MAAATKTYGKVWIDDKDWKIAAEPHIVLRLKRVFGKIDKKEHGTVSLSANAENARDLAWFILRYPMRITPADSERLQRESQGHEDHILSLERILGANYKPKPFKLALPLRDYQMRSARLLLEQGHLLNGDDLGLGKSCQAIAGMTDKRALPALVVCYPHLQTQWKAEIKKFAPNLEVHIIKKGTPYTLPQFMGRGPDVLITTYSKLSGWAEFLAQYCQYITFDEIQELRRSDSAKYKAAAHIASACAFRYGLTATPVFNYGGELFNILNVLKPGCLGDKDEFVREWCSHVDSRGNAVLKDPKAFGSYLREQMFYLRRTRIEVGRELPPVTKILQQIDSDATALDAIEDSAGELARIILAQGEAKKGDRLQAAGEFDALMRQATGLAKAPFVADFVNLMCESEPKIVLCGWHRSVYEVWKAKLAKAGRKCVMYTGSETPAQKDQAVLDFVEGDAQVFILSNRSGAGLNRLQEICRTVVKGELDWSPAVHDQIIGRLNRDGQVGGGVMVYFLVSDFGADPVMTEILGLKRQQADGVKNPEQDLLEVLQTGGGHLKRLAEHFLKKNHLPVGEAA